MACLRIKKEIKIIKYNVSDKYVKSVLHNKPLITENDPLVNNFIVFLSSNSTEICLSFRKNMRMGLLSFPRYLDHTLPGNIRYIPVEESRGDPWLKV